MASIHKRPDSPYWIAAFTDAKGRRVKRTTRTKDRGLALKILLEWDKAARLGQEEKLFEAQCRKVLSDILTQATGHSLDQHICRNWCDEWVATKVGAVSKATVLKYRQVVTNFLEFLGEKADQPIESITAQDIREYRDTMAATGLAAATVNQTIQKCVSAPFSAAARAGLIVSNPCSGIDSLKDDADLEKDVFTIKQIHQLYAVAEGDWKGAILAGYFTGLRLSDVATLRWEYIDFESNLIRLKTKKTGAGITIPIAHNLLVWLMCQSKETKSVWVFPSLANHSAPGRGGLSMQFGRIMKKAQIEGRVLRNPDENSSGRKRVSLSYHSLRHSFNSALANMGVAQELRQKLTGHASAAMNAKYTHHEIEPLRAAVALLPSIFGPPQSTKDIKKKQASKLMKKH